MEMLEIYFDAKKAETEGWWWSSEAGSDWEARPPFLKRARNMRYAVVYSIASPSE